MAALFLRTLRFGTISEAIVFEELGGALGHVSDI
jgi:hypothetical protein